MFAKLCAKRNKKGFTLAELLIVVAIIAILVAIAIPVFSAKLTEARAQVDAANERTATSLAVAEYLMNAPDKTAAVTYTFGTDDKHQMILNGTGEPKFEITVQAGKVTKIE